MAPTDSASQPRPASTAVLLREAPGGFEVLLTVRPSHLRFMGGASVFPGGSVAPEDLSLGWDEASILSADEASRMLPDDEPRVALGFIVAAIRESFEEVGWLAGTGPTQLLVRSDADSPGRFLAACRATGVRLATDALVPGGRWVTPTGSSVRFDARFFLVLVTSDWEPDPDPNEVAEAAWVTPAQALAELGEGSRLMAPPTIEMLQRLDGHPSAAAAIEAIRTRGVGGAGHLLSVRLSPLVHVVLAPNPGLMTGPGTNTYVVGHEPALVIDPAVPDKRYLDELVSVAGAVRSILVTHRHSDHTGGIEALASRTGASVRAWGDASAGGVPVVPLVDGDLVEVSGVALSALHTPGHASDHLCFFLEDGRVLFAGDNILGEGTAVIAPPDGDMRGYLDSLHRLVKLGPQRVFPGHFRPLEDGSAVIRGYIEHRAARERSILDALASGPLEVAEIVERVYTDVSAELHPIARFSVLAHLEMCEAEKRVRRAGRRWFRVDGD